MATRLTAPAAGRRERNGRFLPRSPGASFSGRHPVTPGPIASPEPSRAGSALGYALSGRAPGPAGPADAARGGAGGSRPDLLFTFSPFLTVDGVVITDLKADGVFLTGRIRSTRAPFPSGRIKCSCFDGR